MNKLANNSQDAEVIELTNQIVQIAEQQLKKAKFKLQRAEVEVMVAKTEVMIAEEQVEHTRRLIAQLDPAPKCNRIQK